MVDTMAGLYGNYMMKARAVEMERVALSGGNE